MAKKKNTQDTKVERSDTKKKASKTKKAVKGKKKNNDLLEEVTLVEVRPKG